jgi:hypothetical protein
VASAPFVEPPPVVPPTDTPGWTTVGSYASVDQRTGVYASRNEDTSRRITARKHPEINDDDDFRDIVKIMSSFSRYGIPVER